jgi:hypothetical protein
MVVESMIERGERLPEEPSDQVEVAVDPRVAVTVRFMSLNYGLLRNLTHREIVSAPVRDGFAYRPDPMNGSRSQTPETHLLIYRFAATNPPGLY